MRWSVVKAVLRRELVDVLRDRRTLFATFVLPVVLYPALTVGFGALAAKEKASLEKREARVIVRLVGDAAGRPWSEHPLVAELAKRPQLVLSDEPDAAAAVRDGRVALGVEAPADLDRRLAAREEVVLRPVYRSHDPASTAAFDAFQEAVRAIRDRYAPLRTEADDLSDAGERGGARFGGMIAFVVVLMALIGTFGPAVDLAAGEKERGTLEALLTTPASRREIVLGKYLAVLACGTASALANLGSLAASLGSLPIGGGAAAVRFSPGGFALVLFGLVLLTAVFGAVALTMSAAARTYKEGAAYLSPLYVVVMPLAMSAMLPTAKFADWWWAPVANVALLVKGVMIGEADPLHALGASAVLLALAAAALETCARAFEREEILFRESGEAVGSVRRGALTGVPTVGLALLAPIAATGLVWFLAPAAQARFGYVGGMVAQFGCLLLAPLVLARAARCPFAGTFGFVRPRPSAIFGGALVGLGGALLALECARAFGGSGAAEAEGLRSQLAPLLDRGLLVAIFSFAVIPGFVEEFHFRGFVMAGLKDGLGRTGAVVGTAVVFAAAHLDRDRFPQLLLLGVLLGAVRLIGGSLWPAVVAHACNNALAVSAVSLDAESALGRFLGSVVGAEDPATRGLTAAVAVILAAVGFVAVKKGRSSLLGGGDEGG